MLRRMFLVASFAFLAELSAAECKCGDKKKYSIRLKTKSGGIVIITVYEKSETNARVAAEKQYKGCTILSLEHKCKK